MGRYPRRQSAINEIVEEIRVALLEAAPEAMVIASRDGRIVQVNAQTEKLFGYQREELLGQNIEMLVPERFRGRLAEHRFGLFTDPRLWPMGVRPPGTDLELYGLRKDSSEFPVGVSLITLEIEEGVLIYGIIRDITERKRAEQVGRELKLMLERRLTDLDLRVAKDRPK